MLVETVRGTGRRRRLARPERRRAGECSDAPRLVFDEGSHDATKRSRRGSARNRLGGTAAWRSPCVGALARGCVALA
jgi:hypothetical protein